MDPQCGQRNSGGSSSRSTGSSSYGSSHHHHAAHGGPYSHQRGHRSSGVANSLTNGFGHSVVPQTSRSSAMAGVTSSSDKMTHQGYLHNASLVEFANPGAVPHGGWHASSAGSLLGPPSPHESMSSSSSRNGHSSLGMHAKRQRIPDAMGVSGGAHHDALMELARENLLLKHQLHVASAEVSRLKGIVEGYEQNCEDSKDANNKSQSRYWTEQEHQRFLEAIQTIGHKDVKAIAQFVGTRSSTQVRTHAQKYFMKLARLKKQEESPENNCSNPDQDPSEAVRSQKACHSHPRDCSQWLAQAEDNANTSMEAAAAAAAAAGEAGTSAAAAAAFVAATNSKQGTSCNQVSNGRAPGQRENASNKAHVRNPGSPNSMGSSGSVGSSDNTSNGNGSNGISTSDNTNGHGSAGSSNSNGRGNENGSSSDSGRCGEASSNEGSDHGFFDTGAEEDNFADDLDPTGSFLPTDKEDLSRQMDDTSRRGYSKGFQAAAANAATSAGGASAGRQ